MNLKLGRVIDHLRKKYPQYTWRYNQHAQWWECEVGNVRYVGCGDDEDAGYAYLYFYRTDDGPTKSVY